MGIAPEPVKQIKGGICKFSVTFCMDNPTPAFRAGFFLKINAGARVFPLKTAKIRRRPAGTNIILTRKYFRRPGL